MSSQSTLNPAPQHVRGHFSLPLPPPLPGIDIDIYYFNTLYITGKNCKQYVSVRD